MWGGEATRKSQPLAREDVYVVWKQRVQWVMFKSCRRVVEGAGASNIDLTFYSHSFLRAGYGRVINSLDFVIHIYNLSGSS